VAFGDINNDGNVDMVILNVGEPPSLLLNRNASSNHRVLFKLVGTKSNKAAIGARVTTVKAGATFRRTMVQMDEVRGGASYISQNDLRLHFGLGANGRMSEVSIRWPNGESETFKSRRGSGFHLHDRRGRRNSAESGAAGFAAPVRFIFESRTTGTAKSPSMSPSCFWICSSGTPLVSGTMVTSPR
jgi:hypothetical protein